MAKITGFSRVGFGQVEPNQLSAQKTGQIYASLKLDPTVNLLQNGEFMYYSYADNMVTAEPTVAGQEPMLVFNEIKIYEDRLNTKDFAMIRVSDSAYVTNPAAVGRVNSGNYGWAAGAPTYGGGSLNVGVDPNPAHSDYQDGYKLEGIAPRLFKTNVGDIFTTNMVELGVDYEEGKILKLKKVTATDGTKTLVLSPTGDINELEFVIAKAYTMPDGQNGIKVQRIK